MLPELGRRIFGYEGSVPGLRQAYRAARLWLQTTFKFQLISVGKGVRIGKGTQIRPQAVSIGDYSAIGEDCLFSAYVTIGRFVMIAANVAIVGGDHRYDVPGVPIIRSGRAERRPVVIEDDVWIGRDSTILHGVTIGEGAIIAARSFVDRDVAPYTIVSSPPAKVIWRRFDNDVDRQKHIEMLANLRRNGEDFTAVEGHAALETAPQPQS
jgi:chloramphenicol O-acetyltransferase type B